MGPAAVPLLVIHNGVDPAFHDDPASLKDVHTDGVVNLLFIGRVSHEKGPDVLLMAASLASARLEQQLRVTVVGSANYSASGDLTEYEQSLRHIAAEARIDVSFLPHVERDKARELMASASAVVLPSRWAEGLPLVALEAMTVGAPVVAFKSPGIVEACGDGALYSERNDAAALADALVHLVTDEAATKTRVGVARERVRSFTWARAWDQFQEILAVPKPDGTTVR